LFGYDWCLFYQTANPNTSTKRTREFEKLFPRGSIYPQKNEDDEEIEEEDEDGDYKFSKLLHWTFSSIII
jgi:hypothetical protein